MCALLGECGDAKYAEDVEEESKAGEVYWDNESETYSLGIGFLCPLFGMGSSMAMRFAGNIGWEI
jgi:hypothetical protein